MPSQDLITLKYGYVALWHITEDEDSLAALALPDTCPSEIISPNKRREWLAGRILVRQLVSTSGLRYDGIYKDAYGKPFLRNCEHHISLSHSYPYVAVQIHPNNSIGIDIEQPKEKLLKIAPRILDSTELENAGDDINKHCVYWCAKEALYKIYGRRGLLFTHHLNVFPFEMHTEGIIQGSIEFEKEKIEVNLQYFIKNDFVLVYSI